MTISNTSAITAKNGSSGLMTPSILISPTLHPVKRMGPTGGVIVPSDRLKIIMIPK
ncbi:hypothetical protein D3C80_2011290 [compost metagenome]